MHVNFNYAYNHKHMQTASIYKFILKKALKYGGFRVLDHCRLCFELFLEISIIWRPVVDQGGGGDDG